MEAVGNKGQDEITYYSKISLPRPLNIKVILYSYLILKKMNERITDS